MKTLLVLLVTIGATVIAVPTPAQAAGCVSHQEYRMVHRHWAKTRVHRVFDTRGRRAAIAHAGGYASEVRTYRGCSSAYSVVSVAYTKAPRGVFRLAAKSAMWAD